MNIFLISNMYPSSNNTFYGIFVKNFADGFKDTKVEIVSKSLIYGKGINRLDKLKKYIKLYLSIILNIFKFNYDLIYIHYPPYNSLPMLLCLPFIKKPIILNFHGTDVFASSKIAKALQIVAIPLIKKAKVIIVPSNNFKQIVIDKFNIKDEKIFISPSAGIDMSIFQHVNGIKDKDLFTLGYVGRIDDGKGWNILLEVVSKLKKEIPNLKCLIAGNGREVNQMKNLINKLDISDFVSYVGSVSHSELSDFYNKLDLFIFPTTLNESLGLVGIEALSCGVPIVGSKIGGLQDYIIDGENGYLFEVNNQNNLYDKIFYLYNNKEILNNFKRIARDSVLRYDRRTVSIDMANMLNKVGNEKI